MSNVPNRASAPVEKNSLTELPVPSRWRPALSSLVAAFVEGDYALERHIAGVAPVSPETATQIEEYIQDYGETLVQLPEETWASSIYIWMGEHWDVLVDLWTEGEGRSDMVLSLRVFEAGADFEFHVYMVYVP